MRVDLRPRIDTAIAVVPLVAQLIEEGEKLVIFLLRNWIEFVVVTLGTCHRQAHENLTGGLDPVDSIVGQILFRDRSPFMGDHVVTVETGGHLL